MYPLVNVKPASIALVPTYTQRTAPSPSGPQPLIAARQERKRRDPRVARLFRLKEAP